MSRKVSRPDRERLVGPQTVRLRSEPRGAFTPGGDVAPRPPSAGDATGEAVRADGAWIVALPTTDRTVWIDAGENDGSDTEDVMRGSCLAILDRS